MLSVIPYLGIVFGLFGIGWGYLAVKFRNVVFGTAVMVVSAIIGLGCQPALAWWHLGTLLDRECQGNVQTLSDSLRMYREKQGQLPATLADLGYG